MSCCSKNPDTLHSEVQDYYGKRVQSTDDLLTNVCKIGKTKMPKHVREAVKLVHEEVAKKFYGCGLTIPDVVEGTAILDLGSGAGLDCFALSKLVGETGHVTGVDMTVEQLAVANKYIAYHTETFGYSKPNVEFLHGYIEKIQEAGAKDNFYDIVISNCVVNLSPDKKAVLEGAYKALKVGGELYFSDIYADRDLPEDVRKHEVLWGECIAGALYWKELHKIAEAVGFSPPRLISAGSFTVEKPDLHELLGDSKFVSAEYRLFKLPATHEQACSATYLGGILEHDDGWSLDTNNKFKTNQPVNVGGEVATILKTSRFAKMFNFGPTAAGATEVVDVTMIDPISYAETMGKPAPCCGKGEPKPACCSQTPQTQACCGTQSKQEGSCCGAAGQTEKGASCCKD